MFSEELDSIEIGSFPGGGALERSYASSNSSTTYDEKDYKGRECRSSSANDVADGYTQKHLGDGLTKEGLAAVDLGRDISSLFPQTAIEMEREGMWLAMPPQLPPATPRSKNYELCPVLNE